LELIRINDVVETFGLSSRALRYYEEKGLIWSHYPDNKTQRHYDPLALERLKQIVVLRKLQIPIKDIVVIFETESTAALIQSFVNKLESLDIEISALSELRQLVDDFLHKMLMSGIKKISAITLLYEETQKRLATIKEEAPTFDAHLKQHTQHIQAASKTHLSFEELSEISREALKLHDIRVIRLPEMRILTSRLKTGEIEELTGEKMQNLFAEYGFMPTPGMRNCFFCKESNDQWLMMMIIPPDYENNTIYTDEIFQGGLYAIASAFIEDMDDTFILLKKWITKSDDYELDADENGVLKRVEMIEEILPWDIATKHNRYQQDVFIPIKIKENK